MTAHELKTWPEFYRAMESGDKTFEIRKNDRDFKIGDMLWLREWNPSTHLYTGCEMSATITYILNGHGCNYMGIGAGYVAIGFKRGNSSLEQRPSSLEKIVPGLEARLIPLAIRVLEARLIPLAIRVVELEERRAVARALLQELSTFGVLRQTPKLYTRVHSYLSEE